MEATDIFVTVPTGDPDSPYARLNLQQLADAFFGLALDLKADAAQNAQMSRQALDAAEKWAGLTERLIEAVEINQKAFTELSKDLHSTAVTAKTIMAGSKAPPGAN